MTRPQLLAAGIARHVLEHRVKAGRLRPVHKGVYQVGPVVAPRAREIAAVLACGPDSLVSHRSAAGLWKILPGRAAPRVVDVTMRAGKRRRAGIRVHRTTTLLDDEVTTLERIPVTTAARTIYDLGAVAGGRTLERAVAEALALRCTDTDGIRRVLDRHPHGRGVRRLRAILEGDGPAFTRSKAEERSLALVDKARLVRPKVNTRVAGYEVDFLWPDHGLVVEIDGFAFHSSTAAFEEDRSRDADLLAAGLRVIRVTWHQIMREPETVVARVAAALGAGATERGGSSPPAIFRRRR